MKSSSSQCSFKLGVRVFEHPQRWQNDDRVENLWFAACKLPLVDALVAICFGLFLRIV